MSKRSRRRTPPASRPNSARERELNTKRRGELAELTFVLKAANLGFGVARPYGDSERYDVILDARDITSSVGRAGMGQASVGQASMGRASMGRASMGRASMERASVGRASVGRAPSPAALPKSKTGNTRKSKTANHLTQASTKNSPGPPPLSPDPSPPLWRIQIKCSTQLCEGLYRVNAHRRSQGRALPYLPGEIHFFAIYIIPETTWYIIPLRATLGRTSLLFRRRADPRPGYNAFREAWRLLRPT